MKYNQAISLSLLIAGVLAAEYEDCKSCYIQYKDSEGSWGVDGDQW